MSAPWQFTTLLDALDHWQALLAGVLGFAAATIAVVLTLRSEQRKAARDLEALRQSIGIEIRQCTAVTFGTFRLLAKLAQKEDGPITYRMVQSCAHFQDALIFPSVADKVGLLGSEAMELLVFYNLIETVRRAVSNLENFRTPDNISPLVVAATVSSLVAVLRKGCVIIAVLKTGDNRIEERDQTLTNEIDAATAAWETVRATKWPSMPGLNAGV